MTVETGSSILAAALEYAGLGLKVVPLFGITEDGHCECHEGEKCKSTGKHPRVRVWQQEATDDVEVIERWWTRWPGSNLGVALGPLSGIIDIECDSPEAEAKFAEMCGGEFPETPTYQSRRGKHRLFQWQQDLPYPDKASWKIGAIDIKTGMGSKGTQSVFPPSRRADGAGYSWLIRPGEVEFAELPPGLYARLWNESDSGGPGQTISRNNASPRHRLYNEPAIVEGGRDETIYAEAVAYWGERVRLHGERCLEDPDTMARAYEVCWAWNAAKCRPPLEDAVIRTKVESARTFIRGQILSGKASAGMRYSKYGLELKEGEWWPGTWTVVIFGSDPIEYHLIVPDWEALIGGDGRIRMSANQFLNAGDVAHAIAVATESVIVDDVPGIWPSIWNGAKGSKKDNRMATRGLKAKLLDIAKREVANPEQRRDVLVISAIADQLHQPTGRWDDAWRGNPTANPEGGVVCKAAGLFRRLEMQIRDIKRTEITRALERFGVENKVLRFGEKIARLYVVTNKQIAEMDSYSAGVTKSACIGGDA